MLSMLVKLVLIAAAAAGLSLVVAPQANASTYEWDDLRNGVEVSLGERVTILVCWDSAARVTLYRDDETSVSGRRFVDGVRGVKNTRLCGRKNPYLQRHTWTVDSVPEPDADGRRTTGFYLGQNGASNWSTWVEVSSGAESDEPSYTPSPSVAPTPTPSVTPTQASAAPTPVATTPSQFNNAFASTLWNAAQRAPDRQYGRCLTLADPKYDVDSREFYKLGAWSGQQLHNLSYGDALTTVWFAYQVYCDGTFGIKTRW